MSNMTLTATRLFEGVWEGILNVSGADADAQPEISVTLLGNPVAGVVLTRIERKSDWLVQIPVPPEALSDGVHIFSISDPQSGAGLGNFAILAGDVLNDNMRVELDLLRAELDMLKQAFRRHCVETK